MHRGPSGFLQAPLLSRTFQASPVSGPLHMLILCGLFLHSPSSLLPTPILLPPQVSACKPPPPGSLPSCSWETPPLYPASPLLPPLTVTPAQQGWASTSQLYGQAAPECVWKKCEPSRWADGLGCTPTTGSLLPSMPPQTIHLSSQDPSHPDQGPAPPAPLHLPHTDLLPSLPVERGLRQGPLQPVQEPSHQPACGREQAMSKRQGSWRN